MVEHRTLREGIIAGLIGATTVAVWFFVVDLIAGRPLFTPSALGEALMNVLGPNRGEGALEYVMLYTVFHYAVFIILGTIAVAIIHASDREPSLMAGFVILFVVFQLGFFFFVMLLERSLLGNIAWYQIGAANVLAALLMGRYLVRMHPEIVVRMGEGLRDSRVGSR
jgi:hypothetical protein